MGAVGYVCKSAAASELMGALRAAIPKEGGQR